MSTDAQTIQEVLPSLNMIWSMPFQILLSLYFLYSELGPAVFSGVAILVLLIPFNIQTGKLSRQYQSAQMKCKDKRIRAMYEILNSIKIIKLNAWEDSFQVWAPTGVARLHSGFRWVPSIFFGFLKTEMPLALFSTLSLLSIALYYGPCFVYMPPME